MKSLLRPTQLLQQELALNVYLSALLEEIPDAVLDDVEPAVALEQDLKQPPIDTHVAIEPTALMPLPRVPTLAPEHPVVQATEVQPIRFLSRMPDWSRTEFQALFFKVDQLIVATPLIALSRTVKFNRRPTRIPDQPSWFLGLLEDQHKKVGLLDSGQLLFGKLKGAQRDLQEQPFSNLLISADGNWGFACDDILSIGTLSPEKIRWRTLRKNRPWLIGTAIDELTAVIDINQLIPATTRRDEGSVENARATGM
jgi:purine-binding chemotaxis protein CheW